MMEFDTTQGRVIQSLHFTILSITVFLELIVIAVSIFFANRFSWRLHKIMTSMKIIQNGDYSHTVTLSGNDELVYLAEEFNDLTKRLQTSENKRTQFVSDASHELKTPLATIKLLSDTVLQNDMDIETAREFVADIGNEAERLNHMTQKLLDLTRGSVTDGQDQRGVIMFSPTVERVLHMLTPLANSLDITIETHLDNDTPILMLEDDLYCIIFNLAENGIKYNRPGGTLTISLCRTEKQGILTVSDTGTGIPDYALEKIFERFYRVDKARSRASGGSGLGLAIVRNMVERNDGFIKVESMLDEGSTFTVTFPLFETEVQSE
jgi:signal transduction histidine kinase